MKKNHVAIFFLINQIAIQVQKTTFSIRTPKTSKKNDQKKRSFSLAIFVYHSFDIQVFATKTQNTSILNTQQATNHLFNLYGSRDHYM